MSAQIPRLPLLLGHLSADSVPRLGSVQVRCAASTGDALSCRLNVPSGSMRLVCSLDAAWLLSAHVPLCKARLFVLPSIAASDVAACLDLCLSIQANFPLWPLGQCVAREARCAMSSLTALWTYYLMRLVWLARNLLCSHFEVVSAQLFISTVT